jgi:thiamine biosynthesis lipoprotein
MPRPGRPAADAARLHRREGRALGSPLRLSIESGADSAAVDRAWSTTTGVFASVDAAMSRFRDDSELTRLNRGSGTLDGPSRDLVRGLVAADRAHRVTGGRFDARVMADLERLGIAGVDRSSGWVSGQRFHLGAGRLADPGGLDRPPTRLVSIDRHAGTVRIMEPVDLGGIGKGLALRWAARAVAALIPDQGFLIEAGGDIAASGSVAGLPWSVAIEDPSGGAEPVATCVLGDRDAIATSSVRIGRWRDRGGRPVHHLIDPRSGEPGGEGLSAVTVAWPDPAWAEVWSKALFLEGADRIAEQARHRGIAAWWVTDQGELSMTAAARQRTTWLRAEAVAAHHAN